MSAEPVEKEIFGVRVSSVPLPFKRSQPLIPTIAEILSIASRDFATLAGSGKLDPKADLADPMVLGKIVPALGALAQYLDGRLEKLSAQLLVTTRIVLDGEWREMVKESDRDYVFDQRPDLFLPSVIHAGRTTFARFFPARDQSGSAPASPIR